MESVSLVSTVSSLRFPTFILLISQCLPLSEQRRSDRVKRYVTSTVKRPVKKPVVPRLNAPAQKYVNGTKLCQTPSCVDAVSNIYNKMDTKVKPCDDIYEFSCGKLWDEMVKGSNVQTMFNSKNIHESNMKKCMQLLHSTMQANEPQWSKLPKLFYQACTDMKTRERAGVKPAVTMMNKLGGWPVLVGDQWDEGGWNWLAYSYQHRDILNVPNYLFILSIDSTHFMKLEMNCPSFGLPRDDLIEGFNGANVQKYYKFMVDFATLFGADRYKAECELKKSLQFEIDLAIAACKAYEPEHERSRNGMPTETKMSMLKLLEEYPSVPWMEYFKRMYGKNLPIDMVTLVHVRMPYYFKRLTRLLDKTTTRTQANYLQWRTLLSSLDYLSGSLGQLHNSYLKSQNKNKPVETNAEFCTRNAVDGFDMAVNAMFVRKYHKDTKVPAEKIINSIKVQYIKKIPEMSWMTDSAQRTAMHKIEAMGLYIGYPDDLLDDAAMNDYYKNLSIDVTDFFGSTLKLGVFLLDKEVEEGYDSKKTSWSHFKKIIDPFYVYDNKKNILRFPVGSFEGAMFEINRPVYMDYGFLGLNAAHEMAHAIDQWGRGFDGKSNGDWWGDETMRNYEEIKQCLISQYCKDNSDEYCPADTTDALERKDEIIRDFFAAKMAYGAFRDWVDQYGDVPDLPGLQMYSDKQMFWISAGIGMCRKNMRKQDLTGGEQFVDTCRMRMQMTFANIKEFAIDFNCDKGCPMSPVETCSLV